MPVFAISCYVSIFRPVFKNGGFLGYFGGSGGVRRGGFSGGRKSANFPIFGPPGNSRKFPPGDSGARGGSFWGVPEGVIFGGILWVIPEPHTMACRCKMLTLKGEASLTRHRDPMHVHSPIALHVDDDRNVNDE